MQSVLNGPQIDRSSSELQPSPIIKKDFLFFREPAVHFSEHSVCVWNSSWPTAPLGLLSATVDHEGNMGEKSPKIHEAN